VVQTSPIQASSFTFYKGSTADNLTAVTGASQTTALALTAAVNRVTTALAGAGVSLPATVGAAGAWDLKGAPCRIINATLVDINVFSAPNSSDTINGVAGSTAFVVPAGAVATFIGATGYPNAIIGAWYASVSGGSGGPLDSATQFNVQALGSNSQSGAAAVTPGNIIVSASGSTRSIRLSSAGSNKSYAVFNDSAFNLNVYPATNATIGVAATNVKVVVAARKGSLFVYKNSVHVVTMGVGGV